MRKIPQPASLGLPLTHRGKVRMAGTFNTQMESFYPPESQPPDLARINKEVLAGPLPRII